MNYLSVLSKIICFGSAILFLIIPAGAQDVLSSPVRDYWPIDGWRESAPEQQGMDSQVLAKIKPYIDQELPQVRSVLIVRHGYLVYEKYFQYFNRDYKQGVASITKSISSALVGIALKEGYLKNLDQKLVDFSSDAITPDIDPRVQKITLKHLLTMSSGFDKGDIRWKTIQEKIRQKPIHEPGEIFDYDNDAVDLLAPILIKTTNMSLLDFAKKYLFGPLGISDVIWEFSALTAFGKEPYHHTMWGISLTPRDMAKFGYLYLNNGFWDGKQIVPSEFVRESTQKQIQTKELSGSEYLDYGYLWWVGKIERYPFYAAAGSGGQSILILSDLDMVIVITSRREEPVGENISIIDKFIVPSILKK